MLKLVGFILNNTVFLELKFTIMVKNDQIFLFKSQIARSWLVAVGYFLEN